MYMYHLSIRPVLPALLSCAFIIASVAQSTLLRDEPALVADPGGPYFLVDWDGDGSGMIDLDGSNSLAGPGAGRNISKYIWSYSRLGNRVFEESVSPFYSLTVRRGITLLRLTVVNDWNETASATTAVDMRKPYPEELNPPNITSIYPPIGPAVSQFSVRISGNRFYNNPIVRFGDITPHFRVISDNEIEVIAPLLVNVTSENVSVVVRVDSDFGKCNNSIEYTYYAELEDPIRFTYDVIKRKYSNGTVANFRPKLITTVKVGPDGLYYMGSKNGNLYKFSLDYETLTVRGLCESKPIGNGRVILGINFHPHEWNTPRLYVSSNLLYWKNQRTGDWNNGRVEVWDSVSTAECMRFSHTVLSGLPVSNELHGVEAIEFLNNGDMLVSIGGTTNAGADRYTDNLGDIPESYFSGAILIAKLSLRQEFDGRIKYTNMTDLYITDVVNRTNNEPESVALYATGLRNVFAMVRHSNGKLYAADNGPNDKQGWISITCGDIIESHAIYMDKILLIKENAYYGHPNWNRARYDERQCKYVRRNSTFNLQNNLNINESYAVNTSSIGDMSIERPLIYLESGVESIIEYTARRFSGKLQGKLLLSRWSWDKESEILVAKLSEDGEYLVEEPKTLLSDSALSIAMGPYGHLLVPKHSGKTVGLYTPVEISGHEALRIIAITPRRGPLGGGNSVFITGNGFMFEGFKIYFNDTECISYRKRREDSVWCQVPPGNHGVKVPVVVKLDFAEFTSKPSDYEYMSY